MQFPRTPWWRPLLWAVGPVVLAVGVLVFLIAHYNNDGGSSAKPLPPAPAAPAANKVDQKAFDEEAQQVARRFILTAVARRNTGASWTLLDSEYPGKSEYTKKTWAKGDIPVIPASFPLTNLKEARFRVTESFPKQLTVEVAFFPKNRKPELFVIGLRDRGKGTNRHWLVDYWMTRYVPGVRAEPE
jgi:hypothetical protein